MFIFLMQHGACLPKELNAEQPLSPVGRSQVARSAEALRQLGFGFDAMAASTRQRAMQTAEIVAEIMAAPGIKISRSDALKPTAPVEETIRFLAGFERRQSLLVAGHMPNLGLLASHLLCPAHEPLSLGIENAGVALIEIRSPLERNGHLHWLLKAQHLSRMLAPQGRESGE